MAKVRKQTEDEEFFANRKLTDIELRGLDLEVKRVGGFEKFLELKGVVKLNKLGMMDTVIIEDGLASANKELFPGTGIVHNTDIAYDDWRKVRSQLEFYQARREYAQRKTNEELEKMEEAVEGGQVHSGQERETKTL